jgi:peptidoglycan/LPS O-acetylase OafA/YrhL
MPTLAAILPAERNNFGLIRLLAASSVVISHAYIIVRGDGAVEPLEALTGISLGQHAVNVFFFTSGLLVAASLARSRSIGDFALARFLRICPGLMVCLAVCAFVVGPLATTLAPARYLTDGAVYLWLLVTGSLLHITMPLPGVFEHAPYPDVVDLPLWTLKYEIACYVLLGLAGVTGLVRRGARFWAIYAGLVVVYAATLVFPELTFGIVAVQHMLHLAVLFGLGVAAYRLREGLPLSWFWLAVCLAIYAAAYSGPLRLLATALLTGYATLILAALPLGALAHPFRRIDLSYGIYIYGWPTQQLIIDKLPGSSIAEVAIIALAIAGCLAFLSWTFVEKPMLAFRHKPLPSVRRLAAAIGRTAGTGAMAHLGKPGASGSS